VARSATNWTDDKIAVLLACHGGSELAAAFPGISISTLRSAKYKFRATHGHLVPTQAAAPDIELAAPGERSVPLRVHQSTLRQLDALRDKRVEYVRALQEAVFEAVQEVVITPPLARRPGAAKSGTEEIAVAMVSDLQLGKRTVSYDSDVCERRMIKLAESSVKIARIQGRDHPVKKIHVQLLGDIIEGEGIFPHQAHEIDSGLYRQVGVNGPRILSEYIMALLTYFDTVHITAVIGNHGALKLGPAAPDPETNMDRLLYRIVQLMFRDEPRVTWDIPDGAGERNWYAVDRIFNYGFLLAHGDQIRGGFAGFPWYGAAKKAWGWIDSIEEPWDALHFGHYHTPTYMTLNRRVARCNGSTESHNAYAQEQLAAVGFPTQWLGFVHPDHGVTSEYWVHLGDEETNTSRTPNRQRAERWAR